MGCTADSALEKKSLQLWVFHELPRSTRWGVGPTWGPHYLGHPEAGCLYAAPPPMIRMAL